MSFFNLGASSDFDNATQIAKRMVTRFGMSEKVVDFQCHLLIDVCVGNILLCCLIPNSFEIYSYHCSE